MCLRLCELLLSNTIDEWLKNNRYLFLTFGKLGRPRSGHWPFRCLVRACFPGSQTALFSAGTSCSRRSKGALCGLFYKGLHSVQEDSTVMISSPPKSPLPNTITLEIRFQHMNWGRGGGGLHEHLVYEATYRISAKKNPLFVRQEIPYELLFT